MNIPFVGPTYNLDDRPASVQRSVNLMPLPVELGNERAGWVFRDVPGLNSWSGGEDDILWSNTDIDAAHWSLSADRKTATGSSGFGGVRLDTYRSAGKRYLEFQVHIDSLSANNVQQLNFPMATNAWIAATGDDPSNYGFGWSILRGPYTRHSNVNRNHEHGSIDAGFTHVVMIAIDFSAGSIGWGMDGIWYGYGPFNVFDPVTGANPQYTDVVGPLTLGCCNGGGSWMVGSLIAHTKAAEMTYAIPTGYISFATQE